MFANEIVETYKQLVGISEDQEKQCDFSRFLKINISKLCHRILIIFFQSNMQLGSFWLSIYLYHLQFFTIVIIHSINPSFAQKSCSSAHFGGHFEKTIGVLEYTFLHFSLV